jgi:glutaredoxin-related protein
MMKLLVVPHSYVRKENVVPFMKGTNKVLAVTRKGCPYSEKLRHVLTRCNQVIDHQIHDTEESERLYRDLCIHVRDARVDDDWNHTVPLVFVNGDFIGGFTDFKKLLTYNVLNCNSIMHNK